MNALLERKAAVSVPTGICFLNVSDIWLYNTRYNSFRPLTGICFSKYQYCSVLYKEDFKFPSPYGDMFF